MDERPQVRPVHDTRRPAYGLGRILVGIFACMGLIILLPAAASLVRRPFEDALVESINLVGGALYILLAVCVAHNGRRMRNIGWMSLAALATMAVLIGALTLSGPTPHLGHSVWDRAGAGLWYLPAILPVVAAVWMWMSDPRRIVLHAERITELSDSLSGSLERSRPTGRAGAEPAAQDPEQDQDPGL